MLFQPTNSKSSRSAQSVALDKISSLITRFHAVLLPKANDSGVYRDLSEEQQYLLTNLDNDNPLHSILAGCLAIDSCLCSISQAQQNLTDNILKSVTALCSTWQHIQNQLIKSIETQNLTIQKIERLWKQVEISTKKLLNFCHELPFSQENDEIRKQQKIMSQQDITFKLGSTKLLEKSYEDQSDSNIKQLQQENIKLKQQLQFAQKKAIRLQLQVNKLTGNIKVKQVSKQKIQSQRKYSQTDGERDDNIYSNQWPHFASPSSTGTGQQKQIQNLKDQIALYEKNIAKMKQQFAKQKKRLVREIKILEEELRTAELNEDGQLIELLQQLEYEIQSLREQRRHDERIINQIQQKLEGMTVSKQSRISRGLIKQSRIPMKYSRIHHYDKDGYMDDISDIQSRSPSFIKNHRGRERIMTNNQQVSRSSISLPKTHNYNQQNPHQRDKYNWRQSREGNLDKHHQYYVSRGHQPKQSNLKYSRIAQQQGFRSAELHAEPGSRKNIERKSKKINQRDLYAIPMIQSKIAEGNARHQERPIAYTRSSKRIGYQEEQVKPKYKLRINNINQNAGGRIQWQTQQPNANQRYDIRMKSSRV